MTAISLKAYDFSATNIDGVAIYYQISDNLEKTVSVTSGDSEYAGFVNIPSSVDYLGETYAVSSIGDKAFYYCGNLDAVTIPNSVTEIGKYAFSKCISLPSVVIPNSVITILDDAFSWCENLESVTLPNSLTKIEDRPRKCY